MLWMLILKFQGQNKQVPLHIKVMVILATASLISAITAFVNQDFVLCSFIVIYPRSSLISWHHLCKYLATVHPSPYSSTTDYMKYLYVVIFVIATINNSIFIRNPKLLYSKWWKLLHDCLFEREEIFWPIKFPYSTPLLYAPPCYGPCTLY